MNTYRLIINADDFGSHELINSAVEDALHNGICRSASLMGGGKAFDDAVKIAFSNKYLGVGIHFTLVKGSPVLSPSKIKSLIDPSTGKFHDDFSIFVKRYLTGRINFEEVKAELSAQAHKIQKTGIKISHVDSHQHLHVLPKIFAIVSELAKELNVKAMRIPLVNQLTFSPSKAGLKFLSLEAKHRAKNLNFAVPDNFFGIVAGDAFNEDWLCSVIDKKQYGTTEIMTHLGKNNEILQPELNWQHDFEAELKAVKSEIVKEKIESNNIKIINFFDIA